MLTRENQPMHISDHGITVITGFHLIDRDPTGRDEEYYRKADGSMVEETRHCLTRGDNSAPYSYYPTGYDSRCGMCYLNAGHTTERHNHAIIQHELTDE